MKFSERKNYKKPSTLIQTDGMNDELRHSIWNVLFMSKWDLGSTTSSIERDQILKDLDTFSAILWFNYFKKPVDSRPNWRRATGWPGRTTAGRGARWFSGTGRRSGTGMAREAT